MYAPVPDGFSRNADAVLYTDVAPPVELHQVVHGFWELKTQAALPADFLYHALPDACVNLLFNQLDPRIAGVTALQTTSRVLNLGTTFHYVGIQFFPGVWQGDRAEWQDSYVGTPWTGRLPLIETGERMAGKEFPQKVAALTELVGWCIAEGYVAPNPVTARILADLDAIRTVNDMAERARISTRHLHRTLKRTTGLSPQEFLKILRIQRSFRTHYLDVYADQSHFIHAFRNATGYTPQRYRTQFR
jgi:AraC-like DNA-binding protein